MNKNKKSGHPTQPDSRYIAPPPYQGKQKRKPILYRIVRFFKRLNAGEIVMLVLDILAVGVVLWYVLGGNSTAPADQADTQPEQAQTETQEEAPAEAPAEAPTEAPQEYIFRDGEGYPLDVQSMTREWAAEAGMEKRYDLTDAERWEVASVVTAEAVGEPFAGKVAVAQCILQACEDDRIRPDEAVVKYGYAKSRPEPTEEALEAVQAVFDFGHVATTQPIKYFYAPARCRSDWHETQVYVMTINGHKFFKEAK